MGNVLRTFDCTLGRAILSTPDSVSRLWQRIPPESVRRVAHGCNGRSIRVRCGFAIPGRLLFGEFAQTFFFLLSLFFQISLTFFKRVIWFGQKFSLISFAAESNCTSIEKRQ